MPVFIPFSYIARSEPAVFCEGGGVFGRGGAVVARHYGVAADQDLALWWVVGGEVAGVWEIDEFDLDGAWDGTEGVIGPLEGVLEGSHPVAYQPRDKSPKLF